MTSEVPNSDQPTEQVTPVEEVAAAETVSGSAEDWWAVACAALLLAAAFFAAWGARPDNIAELAASGEKFTINFPNNLKPAKPGSWTAQPIDAVLPHKKDGTVDFAPLWGTLRAFGVLGVLFLIVTVCRGGSGTQFLRAFPAVFALAFLAYILAGQSVIKSYNLEYALWALFVGLLISNTVGTPNWLKAGVQTEFYIKTGLVLLGAEILMGRLLALGLPGVFVAWVVTPIVLISTYVFGQKVLKLESRSLNMVISADMSVCGVSAAIATAAACKAKKEELSLAIGLSLSFTVVMMVVMPAVISATGMDQVLGGAWMGGTIDATGAVAAAGALVGNTALEVASTVKMIQNILIGVISFCVAVYWVTCVEHDPSAPRPGAGEIWRRFPKFVLGFMAASIVFSLIHKTQLAGPELVDAVIKGATKTLRGWLFCLAFVSIGLATNFRELLPHLKKGKPLVLYLCGQTLNLLLTLLMAWLMFRVVYREFIDAKFAQ